MFPNSHSVAFSDTPRSRPRRDRPLKGLEERSERAALVLTCDEHFRVEGRRTWFETIEEMQAVLDKYLVTYNRKRPHQGRRMNGRTPWQAFQEGLPGGAKTNRTAKQEVQKAA